MADESVSCYLDECIASLKICLWTLFQLLIGWRKFRDVNLLSDWSEKVCRPWEWNISAVINITLTLRAQDFVHRTMPYLSAITIAIKRYCWHALILATTHVTYGFLSRKEDPPQCIPCCCTLSLKCFIVIISSWAFWKGWFYQNHCFCQRNLSLPQILKSLLILVLHCCDMQFWVLLVCHLSNHLLGDIILFISFVESSQPISLVALLLSPSSVFTFSTTEWHAYNPA